jgi:hypothetical protein
MARKRKAAEDDDDDDGGSQSQSQSLASAASPLSPEETEKLAAELARWGERAAPAVLPSLRRTRT